MFLYHGTREDTATLIRQRGLLPRCQHRGKHNWDHAFAGNRHVVYLTDAYPVTYAVEAVSNVKHPQRLAIIEVATEQLDTSNLVPDEDMLEQLWRGQDDLPEDWPLKKRGAYYRSRIRQNADLWQKSLTLLGTCGHFGAIPAGAISRIALVDYRKAAPAVWWAINASVTFANYRLVGTQHKAITRWFFGDPMPEFANETDRFLNEDHVAKIATFPRDGVEVLDLKST